MKNFELITIVKTDDNIEKKQLGEGVIFSNGRVAFTWTIGNVSSVVIHDHLINFYVISVKGQEDRRIHFMDDDIVYNGIDNKYIYFNIPKIKEPKDTFKITRLGEYMGGDTIGEGFINDNDDIFYNHINDDQLHLRYFKNLDKLSDEISSWIINKKKYKQSDHTIRIDFRKNEKKSKILCKMYIPIEIGYCSIKPNFSEYHTIPTY